ncbi:MAG: tannase/feruloyl esterase family alpha/beta hydrolase [Acidobacteria bacterium]|nr:tannase/feruloyl esterase family alpha/beta hydrolase [Acidobacteriota bacterium]
MGFGRGRGWGIVGLLAWLGLVADGYGGLAAGQNGSSFRDASSSAIDYRVPFVTRGGPAEACRALRGLTSHDYSIVSATLVGATGDVGEHCRVYGVIQPEVKFGVHLPTAWNGRFYMQGNGGYAGNAPDAEGTLRTAMRAVANGFAAASTDTGHDARAEPLATFAHDNLAKEIDYAFRAVHLTAVTAQAITATYYETPHRYAYWDGCSTGGRQGLMSAQRFPDDFDGIVAGAPVQNFTDTQMAYVWNNQALARAPLTEADVARVAVAVYEQCDATDGLKDGLIDDPRHCHFDPARDLRVCSGSTADGCFPTGQIETLQAIYSGPVVDGRQLFPGQLLGAEAGGWTNWIVSDRGPTIGSRFSETFFKYMAFTPDEPDFDWRTFDFAADPARATSRNMLDAMDPDLSAFQARGGKMITHFGWADTALNPMMGVNYYEDVRATMGADATNAFYRFFPVPGMFHCSGGLGTDQFDVMTPLVNWVEGGAAPDSIAAARVEQGQVTRTRPLCPYPQVARYSGSGSIDDARSFACAPPQ